MPCATCWRLSWLFQAKLSFIDNEGRRAGIERAVKGIPAEAPIHGLVQTVIGLRIISFHIPYNTCQLTPILKMFSPKTYPTAASSPPLPPKFHSALQAPPQHLPHPKPHTQPPQDPKPTQLPRQQPYPRLPLPPLPPPHHIPDPPHRSQRQLHHQNTSTPNKGTKR